VIVVLRFLGAMNAAAWFGAAVLYTLAVAPAFVSPEMKRLLNGDLYSGAAAQIVTENYWRIYYWCGAIGVVHQLAEWVYLSRPLKRLVTYLLVMLFGIGLVCGLFIQPRLETAYKGKFSRPATGSLSPDQAADAKSFDLLRRTTQILNLLALAGLTVFTWQTIHVQTANGTRFTPSGKFRS
jgi:hypothetical protein